MGVINKLFHYSKGNIDEIQFEVDSISQIGGTDDTKSENVSFPSIVRLEKSMDIYMIFVSQ